MGWLSDHFKTEELSCKCCNDIKISHELVRVLERLRSNFFDTPITVTNCYRCQAHNMEIGGSPSSLHMVGWAVDFYFKGLSIKDTYDKMKKMHDDCFILKGGLGVYFKKGFYHIDIGKHRYWDDKKE